MKPEDLAAVLARVSQRHDIPYGILTGVVAPAARSGDVALLAGLEQKLARRVADIRLLRSHLAEPSPDAALAKWRQSAALALEAGQLSEVDRTLAQAELQILGGLSDLSELSPARRIAVGETRADRAMASLLDLSPQAGRESAKRFAEAAAIIGLADSARSHALALRQADAFKRIGEEFRDRAGFDSAIAHLRVLLTGLDNLDDTLAWAETQERLGLALAGLASLSGEPALLDEAAGCYRAALDDLRREQAKPLWGRLQMHLGTLALQKGEATRDPPLIEEAVAALSAARSVIDAANDPQTAVSVEYSLARALAAEGEHSGSIANLEAAFNGFQTVLKSWTREGHQDIWADVQDRSGAVLRLMSQSYREPVVLEEAIAAFDRALEIRLPHGAPKLWAMTAANRAETLLRLAERQRDLTMAQQALGDLMKVVESLRAAGFEPEAAEMQKRLVAAGHAAAALAKR